GGGVGGGGGGGGGGGSAGRRASLRARPGSRRRPCRRSTSGEPGPCTRTVEPVSDLPRLEPPGDELRHDPLALRQLVGVRDQRRELGCAGGFERDRRAGAGALAEHGAAGD